VSELSVIWNLIREFYEVLLLLVLCLDECEFIFTLTCYSRGDNLTGASWSVKRDCAFLIRSDDAGGRSSPVGWVVMRGCSKLKVVLCPNVA